MRADVAESESFSGAIAPKDQGNFEARGGHQPSATNSVASQNRIPKTPEEFVVSLRGARDCEWQGLFQSSVNPMITAPSTYGPPPRPTTNGLRPWQTAQCFC